MAIRSIECPNCREIHLSDASAPVLKPARCRKCHEPLATLESVAPGSDTPRSSRDSSTEVELPPEATIGRVGRFELRAALGQGAFGRVFRAYDPLLDREVALKLPRAPLENPRRIARFLREAKAAARLRHPSIVTVYESGSTGDEYYIASEFVRGLPLSVRIAEQRPNFHEAVRWVTQIADGLAYAHSEGVIHRDIKPSNIMLGESGRAQLMDFGTAKRLDEDPTMTTEGSLLGTPAYMAPEQARSETKAVGARSDQYSLGVVLYELLTGRKPFDGPVHTVISMVTNVEPPGPRTINPAIPRDLEAICLKAMAKEPSRRYPTVADFSADLERWGRGEIVHARPAQWWERLWRWCRRYPSLASTTAGLAASLVLAAGLGISFAWYESRVAAELAEAANTANRQKSRAEKALDVARFQSKRAGAALRQVQTERDRTAEALAESERQRERAERALKDAERQRIRAETALSDLQTIRVEAESERAQVRRLRMETFLDRGLRQCSQGDAIQGMLWLAEALQLASESSELSDFARVARENLSAWRSHVPRAKRQRPGEVVLEVSPDGANVARGTIRPIDLRSESFRGELLFSYQELLSIDFSTDGRVALVIERQGRTVQAYYLGGGVAAASPPFEGAQVFRTQLHPVAFLDAIGRRVLIQDSSSTATVWDVRSRQTSERPLVSAGNRRIHALALGPLGKRVACITTRGATALTAVDPVLLLLEVETGSQLFEKELRGSAQPLLAFSEDSKWLLAGDQVFDVQSLEPVAGPLPYSEPMRSADISPAGTHIATSSSRSVWMWDTTGKLIREVPCNRDVDEVVFDATGNYALTRDRAHVQVWDVATGRAVGPALEAASGMQPFLSAMVTPGGGELLVATGRGAYRVPRPAKDLPGPAESVKLWVQVLTEAELGRDGSVRTLDEKSWTTRLEALRKVHETGG